MRGATALVGLIVIAAIPSSAQATWGPKAECKRANEWHCYALSSREANDLGSILFADEENAHVYDYEEGGLVTQEQWVSFEPSQTGWIEMGQVEGWGAEYGCCTIHPFFAEETPAGVFHKRVAEGSGYNVYAHYLIYDAEKNKIWRMYWGEWTEEEHYGGWAEERFSEQEAGTEAGTETHPIDTGRDEVARWANGSSPWYPWNGAEYGVFPEGAFYIHHNSQDPAEGNIEWEVG